MPRKPACQTERRPWSFTELAMERVLFTSYFQKCYPSTGLTRMEHLRSKTREGEG